MYTSETGSSGDWFQDRRISGPDTGGGDIGSWAGVGGKMPFLKTVGALAADAGPLVAQRAMGRKAAKDYNDQATSRTAGADDGTVVKESPDWMPAP